MTSERSPQAVTIWTYDWVPERPRGHVRDIRLRWACEEAGIPYEIRTVPLREKEPEHFERQPFGQVPFLQDGDVRLFESGACLLYLARKSEALMPRDPQGEAETLSWTVAALNSIEMVSVPWWYIGLSHPPENPLDGWLNKRLAHLNTVLERREWLAAGRFTVADLLCGGVAQAAGGARVDQEARRGSAAEADRERGRARSR